MHRNVRQSRQHKHLLFIVLFLAKYEISVRVFVDKHGTETHLLFIVLFSAKYCTSIHHRRRVIDSRNELHPKKKKKKKKKKKRETRRQTLAVGVACA